MVFDLNNTKLELVDQLKAGLCPDNLNGTFDVELHESFMRINYLASIASTNIGILFILVYQIIIAYSFFFPIVLWFRKKWKGK